MHDLDWSGFGFLIGVLLFAAGAGVALTGRAPLARGRAAVGARASALSLFFFAPVLLGLAAAWAAEQQRGAEAARGAAVLTVLAAGLVAAPLYRRAAGRACAAGPDARGDEWLDWIELEALLVTGLFLTYSFFAGRIGRFVASYYAWLSPAAGALLFGMLACRWFARGEHGPACACAGEHASPRFPRPAAAAVLMCPIALVLAVNPTQLSVEGARKRLSPLRREKNPRLDRAMQWVMGRPAAPRRAAGVKLPASPTVKQLLELADAGQAAALKGRFVTVIGQCDAASPDARRFQLYRMVVTCCIADALTVSVPVVRRGKTQLEPGGWVRVSGVIQFDSDAGEAVPVIHAAAPVEKIAEPAQPYL